MPSAINLTDDLESYITLMSQPESTLLRQLREDTKQSSPVAHMLCGPLEAALISMLLKLMKAKYCLEIGTFRGYSALAIAGALPNEGKLITCERSASDAALAQQYFDQSPDGHKISLLLGKAMDSITTLSGPFDAIFIDGDKNNYPHYYDKLLPKLRVGGLMIIDNTLWRNEVVSPQSNMAKSIAKLNEKAACDPHVETVLLPIRDGLLLIRKISDC